MKLLLGTPIHQDKKELIKIWLKNVSKLKYPVDVLLIDTSPNIEFMEEVENYCNEYGVKRYKIRHLNIRQENGVDEMVGRSREAIRQEVLNKGYDAWFSWECDQIIPTDGLERLVKLMETANLEMILFDPFSKKIPDWPVQNLGFCLIKKSCLEKTGFLIEYPDMPNCWHAGEKWFKLNILKNGGSYVELFGELR